MKLYKVEATVKVYILSEDTPKRLEIERAFKNELENDDYSNSDITRTYSSNDVEPEWLSAIPYGYKDNEHTIMQLFSKDLIEVNEEPMSLPDENCNCIQSSRVNYE